jgi:hypothetical protein
MPSACLVALLQDLLLWLPVVEMLRASASSSAQTTPTSPSAPKQRQVLGPPLLLCCHSSLTTAQRHHQQLLHQMMPHSQHCRLLLGWQHQLQSLPKQRCSHLVTTRAVAAHRPYKH